MSITQLTAARTKAAPTVEMTPDLIQRVRQLEEYVSEMIELFDEIEPNISIVKNIADELKELESKTITVVNQFTQQIYLKEDEADEIIVLLNQEVQRVEDHIDAVSYTHLTLPTSDLVYTSVVAVYLKKQKKKDLE